MYCKISDSLCILRFNFYSEHVKLHSSIMQTTVVIIPACNCCILFINNVRVILQP